MIFHIITMSTYGKGLSGGDRIWIELAKRWGVKCQTYIYLWEEGLSIARREGLKHVKFILWTAKKWAECGFIINYFARTVVGLSKAVSMRIDNSPETIVYSASEFWQDSLPAMILKLRYPKLKWIAAWYQTSPNPFRGFSENKISRFQLRAFLYWLVQQTIKPFIKRYADLVIVNNEGERKEFAEMNKANKVFVMLGGIDLSKISYYRKKYKKLNKVYDAVFQGRFHPQKGVTELIDIWKLVVLSKPEARLAMIGNGPLMNEVKKRIRDNHLENNVEVFGYLFDGPTKYRVCAQSKLVVHPSVYDSGGMASAEAMAFGIPVVGFNLKAYDSYYPKGMIKVGVGNTVEFATEIITLLNNPILASKKGKEGVKFLKENWTWDRRAELLLNRIRNI